MTSILDLVDYLLLHAAKAAIYGYFISIRLLELC